MFSAEEGRASLRAMTRGGFCDVNGWGGEKRGIRNSASLLGKKGEGMAAAKGWCV